LFEADPRAFPSLEEHEALSNVLVIKKAFVGSGREGKTKFYQSRKVKGSGLFLYERDKGTEDIGGLYVPTINGLQYMRRLTGPMAFSMNAEGTEFIVMPELLEDEDLMGRIILWRVSWHDNAERLPQFAEKKKELGKRMKELGILKMTETVFCLRVIEQVLKE
jgi:hypothetical protein